MPFKSLNALSDDLAGSVFKNFTFHLPNSWPDDMPIIKADHLGIEFDITRKTVLANRLGNIQFLLG